MDIVIENIKKYFTENKINQTKLAGQLNIEVYTLYDILKGKQRMPLNLYAEMCKILDVPMEYFFIQANKYKIDDDKNIVANEPEVDYNVGDRIMEQVNDLKLIVEEFKTLIIHYEQENIKYSELNDKRER